MYRAGASGVGDGAGASLSMRAAVPPLASFEEPIVTWVTINAVTAIAKAIGTAKARTARAGRRRADARLLFGRGGCTRRHGGDAASEQRDGRQLPVDVHDAADDERDGRPGGTRRQHVAAPEGSADRPDGPDEQDDRDDAAVGADGEDGVGIQPDHGVDRPASTPGMPWDRSR